MTPATADILSQFKALADPVRARLFALCAVAECSVSELTQISGQSQPRISQHLKQLCEVNLLQRFKDGHFVFYRVPNEGDASEMRRRLLALLPDDEPQFAADTSKLRSLRSLRSDNDHALLATTGADRSLQRALVELTVVRPLGDLLDIGCGQGRVLKLLASRAVSSVGVDINSDARRLARAELLLASTPNVTLRQGNMISLPFTDQEFDTIILDDVFGDARDSEAAVAEAKRVLKPGGRLLLLAAVDAGNAEQQRRQFAAWAAVTGLQLAPARLVPSKNPEWLLAVATLAKQSSAVA